MKKQYLKYDCNQDFFLNIDSEAKAYWLGFIYADGCIVEPKNRNPYLQILLSSEDTNHIEKFKKDIQFTGPVHTRSAFHKKQQKIYTHSYITIRGNSLIASLKQHGLTANKSLNCIFPTTIPNKYKRDFIRGYFDGDGGITKDCKEISIAGTESFLKSIQDDFIDLGLTPTKLYQHTSGICQYTKHGRLQVGQVLKWLYSNSTTYLTRKVEYINTFYPEWSLTE